MQKNTFKSRLFRHPIETLRVLFRIAGFCRKTTALCSRDYLRVFGRAVRLCFGERFEPDEAYSLGLLDPNLPETELPKFTSRKKLTKIQKTFNPASWAPLLKDKGLFYRYCGALNVPVPKLYAILFRNTAGWAHNGQVPTGPDDWRRFFDAHLPDEFVVKPTVGASGRGVRIFSRVEGGFSEASGGLHNARKLYDAILSYDQCDGFVIQQRLRNHPDLAALSDTEYLQTIRILTFIDDRGRCRILHGHFKPITAHSIIDNFGGGLSGNLLVEISLENGTLKQPARMTRNGLGAETVAVHPKTNVAFEGFRLPLWSEASKLAADTAPKFLPLRTVGWDIALTDHGAVILEANVWWDAINEHRKMDVVLDAMPLDDSKYTLKGSKCPRIKP